MLRQRGITLLQSKEPMFAASEKRKGPYVAYFDCEGAPACCNFTMSNSARLCQVCGNAVVSFIVDDTGAYICSACGKFPRELIQS